MKGTALILFCAFALALGDDEIEVNANGCPLDYTIHKVLEHETYCNLFYNCHRGDRLEQRCPHDLVFNIEHEVCDWQLNVDCGDKKIYEHIDSESEEEEDSVTPGPGGHGDPSEVFEICAKEDSIGVLVAHENCDEFYICDNGGPVALKCPQGLVYNYNKGLCDWPSDVECGDRIVPGPIEIPPNANASVAAYEACAKPNANGQLIPHEHCNRFYQCSVGVPIPLSCPHGLVFNIKLSLCDWPFMVNCDGRPIVEDEEEEEDNESEGGDGDNGDDGDNESEGGDGGDGDDGDDGDNESEGGDGGDGDNESEGGDGDNENEGGDGDNESEGGDGNDGDNESEGGDGDDGDNENEGGDGDNESEGGDGEEDGNSYPSQAAIICAAENSEGLQVAHEICNQFYRCTQGLPVAIECLSNLYFNPKIGICDWLENVDCGDRVINYRRR